MKPANQNASCVWLDSSAITLSTPWCYITLATVQKATIALMVSTVTRSDWLVKTRQRERESCEDAIILWQTNQICCHSEWKHQKDHGVLRFFPRTSARLLLWWVSKLLFRDFCRNTIWEWVPLRSRKLSQWDRCSVADGLPPLSRRIFLWRDRTDTILETVHCWVSHWLNHWVTVAESQSRDD